MRSYNTTVLAARVLLRVLDGQTLESALQRYQDTDVHAQLSHVCFEAMRHYFSLSERIENELNRPRSKLDPEVWCVLLAGACQLEHSRTPPYATVSQSVDAVKKLGKSSAGALVNAVLRKYQTDGELRSEESRCELPNWLIEQIDRDFQGVRAQLIEQFKTRAPLTLRVNSSVTDFEQFCDRLDGAGIAHTIPALPNAITCDEPRPMSSIPGYDEGFFQVQDLSSQMAVPLLEANVNDRILDACASPGVKTSQILDIYPNNATVSVDIRTKCSTWNISRRTQQHDLHGWVQGDLRNTDWWDGVPFDRILLDAPCSGTGTLRRHPDIKVTRQESEVSELASLQRQLLDTCWRVLEPKGKLVYATCSFLREENDDVIQDFLENHGDASTDNIALNHGSATRFGWQLIPVRNEGDGFYFARMRKSQEKT